MGLMTGLDGWFHYVETQRNGQGDITLFFGKSWLPEWATLEMAFLSDEVTIDYLMSHAVFINDPMDTVLIVRNRAARPFWWVLFRIGQTLRMTETYIIWMFDIWGLAHTSLGAVCQWRDIRPIGWIGKRVGLWD